MSLEVDGNLHCDVLKMLKVLYEFISLTVNLMHSVL